MSRFFGFRQKHVGVEIIVWSLVFFCPCVHMAVVIPPQKRVGRVVTCVSSVRSKPFAADPGGAFLSPPRSERKKKNRHSTHSACVFMYMVYSLGWQLVFTVVAQVYSDSFRWCCHIACLVSVTTLCGYAWELRQYNHLDYCSDFPTLYALQ